MSRSDNPDWSFDTLAVRAGQERSQFNEHSEALYLTSSFVFRKRGRGRGAFSGAEPGNVYARFTNPTVTALQERLAALEGAEACIATASGMAAILSHGDGLDESRRAHRRLAQHLRRHAATVRQHPAALRRRNQLCRPGRIEAFAPRCARTPSWCSSRRRRIR
jgi:hypothetical protein